MNGLLALENRANGSRERASHLPTKGSDAPASVRSLMVPVSAAGSLASLLERGRQDRELALAADKDGSGQEALAGLGGVDLQRLAEHRAQLAKDLRGIAVALARL